MLKGRVPVHMWFWPGDEIAVYPNDLRARLEEAVVVCQRLALPDLDRSARAPEECHILVGRRIARGDLCCALKGLLSDLVDPGH